MHEHDTDDVRTITGGCRRRGIPRHAASALALAFAALVAGCTEGEGIEVRRSADAGSAPSGDASIAGLYDASVEFDGIGRDVMRLRVTEDGQLIEYDYQGDEIDRGIDCYVVNTLTLSDDAGGLRTIGDGTRSASFSLTAVERGLELGLVDVSDLDGDGDSTETLRTVLERVDDVDETDMNWCL